MKISNDMASVFNWLHGNKLTADATEFWKTGLSNGAQPGADFFALYSSSASIWKQQKPISFEKMTKEDWDKEREKNTGEFSKRIEEHKDSIIKEVLARPKEIHVDIRRLPPDALAFYRPFHYAPNNEWGIYFVLPKFLDYMNDIMQPFGRSYLMFQPEVVATLVMFEVFHHEYYHHLVESTAFTLETILAEFGIPDSLYLAYNKKERTPDILKYSHHCPLEEALANAYAYNSISFAQRTKLDFDSGVMKAYKAILKEHWRLEPDGYCDAENYIDDGTVRGNASLLKVIMSSDPTSNMEALEVLVARVMPSGFTSMVPKPDIPTYFLGSPADFADLQKFVPNPRAAYAYLELPYNTNEISKAISAEKENRKKAKEALKARRKK